MSLSPCSLPERLKKCRQCVIIEATVGDQPGRTLVALGLQPVSADISLPTLLLPHPKAHYRDRPQGPWLGSLPAPLGRAQRVEG